MCPALNSVPSQLAGVLTIVRCAATYSILPIPVVRAKNGLAPWRRARTCLTDELLARGVFDEDVLGKTLLVGPVARVYQDARVHNGHPSLLLPVQLLHESLQKHSTRDV